MVCCFLFKTMFLGNSLPVFYDFPLEKHSGEDWEGTLHLAYLGMLELDWNGMFFSILVWHGGFWSWNIRTGSGLWAIKVPPSLQYKDLKKCSVLFFSLYDDYIQSLNLDQFKPPNFHSLIWLYQKWQKYLASVLWIIRKAIHW